MIFLRRIELWSGENLSEDLSSFLRQRAVSRLQDQTLLLFGMIKHGVHVLSCHGPPSGIVTAPEEICQFAVRDLSRIEFDLNRLGMVPQIVVSGIVLSSPRVSDTGACDAFDAPEPGICSPKSAERNGCGFCPGCRSGIYRERSGGNSSEEKPRHTCPDDDNVSPSHGDPSLSVILLHEMLMASLVMNQSWRSSLMRISWHPQDLPGRGDPRRSGPPGPMPCVPVFASGFQ